MKSKVILQYIALISILQENIRASSIDDIELPILEVRLETGKNFNPEDPVIIINYSNISRYASALIPIPNQVKREPYGGGLSARFDGMDPASIIDGIEDDIPKNSIWIPPSAETNIIYYVGDRYKIPNGWNTMQVYEMNKEIEYCRFIISRTGNVINREILKIGDINEIKRNILASEALGRNIDRWLLRVLTNKSTSASNMSPNSQSSAHKAETNEILSKTINNSETNLNPNTDGSESNNIFWIIVSGIVILMLLYIFKKARPTAER